MLIVHHQSKFICYSRFIHLHNNIPFSDSSLIIYYSMGILFHHLNILTCSFCLIWIQKYFHRACKSRFLERIGYWEKLGKIVILREKLFLKIIFLMLQKVFAAPQILKWNTQLNFRPIFVILFNSLSLTRPTTNHSNLDLIILQHAWERLHDSASIFANFSFVL